MLPSKLEDITMVVPNFLAVKIFDPRKLSKTTMKVGRILPKKNRCAQTAVKTKLAEFLINLDARM